jgi:hypothetical protein
MKMQMLMINSLLILCITFSFYGDPASTENDNNKFAVYLLADNNLTTIDVQDKPINSLEIKASPLISYPDIIKYDTSNCKIYLAKPKKFYTFDTLRILTGIFGKPFVVVANGERIYLGSFYNPISSWLPNTPLIALFDIDYSERSIKVSSYNISKGSYDIMKDIRIIEAPKQKLM